MASLFVDKRYGTLSVRFRFAGRYYKRAIKTSDRRRANAILARVEDTILLIKQGRIAMPPDVDPGDFILADGKVTTVQVSGQMSLKQMFDSYYNELPPGAKEESTIYGEGIHCRHLLRLLGSRRSVRSIKKSDLQSYIGKRSQEKVRGKHIRPQTIKKELTTLRLVWNWTFAQDRISTPPPTKGLVYPKTDEKYPFMTYDEITRHIADINDADEAKKYWESLYLNPEEISDLLGVVKKAARYEHIYPMLAIVAHTGARKSEVLRSRREDIDFQGGVITLREKKGSKTNSTSFRRVEMSAFLSEVLRTWLASPKAGLTYTISLRHHPKWSQIPVSSDSAQNHFKKTLRDSKWSVVRGFHVFRHSMASNLASAGVDARIIDEFLGHHTDEMRRRYRHFFPHIRREAIRSIFDRKD